MRIYFYIIVVILVISLAACTTPQGDEVTVDFYGEINMTNGSTELEGYLSTGGGLGDQDKYDDVTVYFVAEDGSILDQKRLGDINATYGRLNVSVSTGVHPHFIVFHSDDFWDEKVLVTYREYVDGEWAHRRASSRSGLPGFD